MFVTETDRPGIFILFRRSSWLIEPSSVLTFTLYLSPIYFTPNSKGLLLTPDPYSSLYVRYICIIILCFIFFFSFILLWTGGELGHLGLAGTRLRHECSLWLPSLWVLESPITVFATLSFYHRSNTNHTVWYLNTFGEHAQREQWLFFLLP